MWIAVNTVLSLNCTNILILVQFLKVYRLEHIVRTSEDELLMEVVEINFYKEKLFIKIYKI